ncbi:Hypothetical Protein FCC1311_083202 [Hondaea fermentalgiana]|uniref:Uncharacterized protein n=1 Tax=Hondaea fermentalgiana TaxID=2315210 RepID=A0A2R5GNA2_9STRA|nr:Hypothetical Protein FCC1311_083202 [Hondaea fermentalgiana]|eukprot:GBG32095.1 Hypothetical Protein FCC1311_083202 [Hondaea fermentalgiana]
MERDILEEEEASSAHGATRVQQEQQRTGSLVRPKMCDLEFDDGHDNASMTLGEPQDFASVTTDEDRRQDPNYLHHHHHDQTLDEEEHPLDKSKTNGNNLETGKPERSKQIRCDCKLPWCQEQRAARYDEMKKSIPNWPLHFSSPRCPLQRHEVVHTLRPNLSNKSIRSNYYFLWWHLRPSSFMWVAKFDKRSKDQTPRWIVGRQKINVSANYEPVPHPLVFSLFDPATRQWVPDPDSDLAGDNCLVTLKSGKQAYENPNGPAQAALSAPLSGHHLHAMGHKRPRVEAPTFHPSLFDC